MTIVVNGDGNVLEQITKQLNKLIDVIKVIDYTDQPTVERELAMIKVNAETKNRAEIMQIVDIFRAKIIDISEKTFTVEVTGSVAKIDAIEALLESHGIQEMVRTGKIVMMRGANG